MKDNKLRKILFGNFYEIKGEEGMYIDYIDSNGQTYQFETSKGLLDFLLKENRLLNEQIASLNTTLQERALKLADYDNLFKGLQKEHNLLRGNFTNLKGDFNNLIKYLNVEFVETKSIRTIKKITKK